MSHASSNPRRRPARPSEEENSLADCLRSMSIRKGDTFHPQSGTNQSDFWDPLESRVTTTPTPFRSTTSPKALEDLMIGPGDRRMAELFARVDKAVALNSKIALGNVLSDPEVLPVPTLTVTEHSQETIRPRSRHHSHSSDSGIGSSISDSTEDVDSKPVPTSKAFQTALQVIATNSKEVTPSTSSDTIQSLSNMTEERGLSKYAAQQIHKHIVQPILREESLKEFHELIHTVPERIGDKEIKTLRDLEKTLIFLAPDYSRSPSKYLRFCERTIRVLHTTVTTLHESDQRAPADRPYTQGYFFDLVEQIRRYATILAVTREKQAKGENLDEMDVQENEKLALHGGVSHNGKPAELVRHTADGKVISIATGQPVSETELAAASSMKRPAELDVDDDEALRSMARRKKNAKPEIHTCELCSKEFKRPCDLTKHVKTHERPWKCSDIDCKYHELGWPTEKERDRHVNDKHSNAPSLYHCLFKPCPYTSKRESNCKQHMEKAHGWTYVRSKSNGKGRASIGGTRLPQGSVPPSPASSHLTPLTPIAPSPSVWSASSRSGSMAPPPLASGHGTPFVQPSPDFAGHFNMNFDFNDMANFPTSAFPITPAMSEERRPSGTLSSHSDLHFDSSSFDDISPHDLVFDDFSDLNHFQGDYKFSYTPDSGIGGVSAGPSSSMTHMSPGAQLDQTISYDAMNVDGQYETAASSGPSQDFTLFGATASAASGNGEMFPQLAESSSWSTLDDLGNNLEAHHQDDSEAPQLTVSNSALAELFPELQNH